MINRNNAIITKNGKEYNFLFDTSTILYFEQIWKVCGASIFTAIAELPDVTFFVCNDVVSELMNGSHGFNPTQLNIFFDHILNAEGAMIPDHKENRFLVEEDGEVKYVVLNKISSTDYAQVMLCQNHPELTLVANDRKLIKSGAQVITGRRVFGIPALLDKLLTLHPNNERLKEIKKTGDAMFEKKHAFGKNITK